MQHAAAARAAVEAALLLATARMSGWGLVTEVLPNSTTNLPNQQHSYRMYNAVPETPTRNYCTVAQSFESGTLAQPFGNVW